MGDTPEVAEAKAAFQAAFDAAAAGEHAALAPVNNDVQAEQIPESYLEDLEDVAAAKAAFKAAFDDAEAGGLAAKQAPAPVQVTYSHIPAVYPYYAYNHVLPSLPYSLPALDWLVCPTTVYQSLHKWGYHHQQPSMQ